MKRILLFTLVFTACGQAPSGSITLNFPPNLVTNGILHAAVYESGTCSTLSDPVILTEALVRLSHPANFNAQNQHPMTLSAVPAGDNRMVVAVVEQDGNQIVVPALTTWSSMGRHKQRPIDSEDAHKEPQWATCDQYINDKEGTKRVATASTTHTVQRVRVALFSSARQRTSLIWLTRSS